MVTLALIAYKIGFYLAFVLLGFAGGVIVGVKVSPTKEEIEMNFDKIKQKIRGRRNVVRDGLDVTNITDITKETITKPTSKERRAAKKERRKNK